MFVKSGVNKSTHCCVNGIPARFLKRRFLNWSRMGVREVCEVPVIDLIRFCRGLRTAAREPVSSITNLQFPQTQHPSNVAMDSLPYHEPAPSILLPLSSFLLCLHILAYPFNLVSSGLLGQIFAGIIFGGPLTSWLPLSTQEAIVQLGYIGLILLCYEGTDSML